MKKQYDLLLMAYHALTSKPIQKDFDVHAKQIPQSRRYFSLVGLFIGGVGAIVYYLSEFFFNDAISVIFSMIATIVLTGAFHEKGLIELGNIFFSKGIKTKTTNELSEIRVVGMIGLFLCLLLKYQVLSDMEMFPAFISMITGHGLSRFMIVLWCYSQNNVQYIEMGNVRFSEKISIGDVLVNAVFTIIPLWFFGKYSVFYALIPVWIVYYTLKEFVQKKISRSRGAWVGAIQPITELVFYLAVLVLV